MKKFLIVALVLGMLSSALTNPAHSANLGNGVSLNRIGNSTVPLNQALN